MKKTENMVLTSLFTALLAACAQLVVPFTVPFTMQTFALYTSLLVLGAKQTFAAVGVYIALGAVGAPVFSGFSSGIGVILGQNGGFILSFLLACPIFALALKIFSKSKYAEFFALASATITCYIVGTLWFALVFGISSEGFTALKALSWCVLPFVIPDCVKMLLSMMFCRRLKKRIKI